jgi:hypothetical protein
MSYSTEVLFQSDLNTPELKQSNEYGDFVLHRGGGITIGNRWFPRHVPIEIDFRERKIRRDKYSDFISVEHGGKQILVLEYSCFGCMDSWERLIPYGDTSLHFTVPTPTVRLLWSTFDLVCSAVGCVIFLGSELFDAWLGKGRPPQR